MRRSLASALVALGLALACGGAACRPTRMPEVATPAAPPTSGRPPVVLALVVDQFSAWIAASRVPVLPADGGFARLVREGTWVKEMRYPYAVTDTAPGHASLHTGEVPAVSGIFANEVPDARGERISILRDDDTKLVGENGPTERVGSSARALHAETVADRLRGDRPDAVVLSLSLKDRGAILPAGRGATHTVWFDAKVGSFVTSTSFASALPAWVKAEGGVAAVDRRRREPWTLLDRAWVASHAATPDDARGEGDFEGLGTTFPHTTKTTSSFRATPAADEALVALALAGAKAEYRKDAPLLVLASFSTHDILAHVFGADSWEAWDQLRRLDQRLLELWKGLEAITGGPVGVLLSADHGDVAMPEAAEANARARGAKCAPEGTDSLERPCTGGVRLAAERLRDAIRTAVETELGRSDLVAGVADPYVFLTPAARVLPPAKRKALDDVVRKVLARHEDGIDRVVDVEEMLSSCPARLEAAAKMPARAKPGEDVLTLVCRALPPRTVVGGRLGDLYVVPRRGSFFDADYVPGFGTSHGTPYLYDRTVPLFVHAPGLIPAGKVITQPVDFSAYAALEAALLGLPAKVPATDGKPMTPAAVLDAHVAH